jgi:hypothetical protein
VYSLGKKKEVKQGQCRCGKICKEEWVYRWGEVSVYFRFLTCHTLYIFWKQITADYTMEAIIDGGKTV